MIIGIFGYARSGKSTVAEYLEKKHKFKRVNFKDALVKEMKENFPDLLEEILKIYSSGGVPRLDMKWGCETIDELFEQKPELVRKLMQNYGTEVRRKDDPEYWTKLWDLTIRNTTGNIVVDDVRFFNELSAMTERDAIFLRVKRTDITSAGKHQSETEQELFVDDFTLSADEGDIKNLQEQVEDVLKTIKDNND